METNGNVRMCSWFLTLSDTAEQRIEEKLQNLKIFRQKELVYSSFDSGFLAISPLSADPLFSYSILRHEKRLFFLQGIFFDEVDIKKLRSFLCSQELTSSGLAEVVNQFNGLFSGLLVDPEAGSTWAFTDYYGFARVFFRPKGKEISFSSTIWPLLDPGEPHELDPFSVLDTLFLGYTLHGKTLFNDVRMLQAGHLLHFHDGKTDISRYEILPARTPVSKAEAVRKFQDAYDRHYGFVKSKVASDAFVATLTSGHDTRVIINSLLSAGIHPSCLSGNLNTSGHILDFDTRGGKRIADILNIPYHVVKLYNDYVEDDKVLHSNAFFMSDGYSSSGTVAKITRTASTMGELLYMGISGNVVSGDWYLDEKGVNGSSVEAETFFINYDQEYISPISEMMKIYPDLSEQEYFDHYKSTFESIPADMPVYDRFQTHMIENRNFIRLGSAHLVYRLYGNPVPLLHDKQLFRLFKTLPLPLMKHRNIYNRLAYIVEPRLGNVPTNKWHVPLKYESQAFFMIEFIQKVLRARLRKRYEKGKRPEALKASIAAVEAKYEEELKMCADLGMFDNEAFKNVLASDSFGGARLKTRVKNIWRMVQFSKGLPFADLDQTSILTPQATPQRVHEVVDQKKQMT